MSEFEKDLVTYHRLKSNLLSMCKRIEHCQCSSIHAYQDIAICYTNALNNYAKYLNDTYGVFI